MNVRGARLPAWPAARKPIRCASAQTQLPSAERQHPPGNHRGRAGEPHRRWGPTNHVKMHGDRHAASHKRLLAASHVSPACRLLAFRKYCSMQDRVEVSLLRPSSALRRRSDIDARDSACMQESSEWAPERTSTAELRGVDCRPAGHMLS